MSLNNLLFVLNSAVTTILQLQDSSSLPVLDQPRADVQGMYTPPKFTAPPPLTSYEFNYPAKGPRRFFGHAVAPGTQGDLDNDNVNEYALNEKKTAPNLRLSDNDEGLFIMPTGISPDPEDVAELKGSADKQVFSATHQGNAFSNVGCAYVGRACTAFYYPYSTYSKDDKSIDSSKVAINDGYRQPFGVTGDTTDYQWNVMSSFPYIAKSPLFGRIVHGTAFDDVVTSPQIFAGKVIKVTIYGTTRVTSIHVQYEGDYSVWHGTQSKGETLETIDLDDDEDIIEGLFSNCKVNDHTRLCGATLVTTKGKKISRGRFGEKVYHTVLPNGFVFAGFFGREGKNIDQVGLVGIKTDALEAARKAFPVPQIAVAGWRQTQFPGLVSSELQGGHWGTKFNLGLTMPSNIMQMKLNKLSVYGMSKDGKGVFAGFTFGYEDGSTIDIGGTKDDKKPAIIDLGSTGRITRITITEYQQKHEECHWESFYVDVYDPKTKEYREEWHVRRKCTPDPRLRTGGAIIDYIDRDGKKQSVSRGQVDLKKQTHKILNIPTGMELVAAEGGQGDMLDNIAFFLRPSTSSPIKNAMPPSVLDGFVPESQPTPLLEDDLIPVNQNALPSFSARRVLPQKPTNSSPGK